VKIVDLGVYYAGPYASRLLADLGAEVIKVEPPAGDPMRGLPRLFFAGQAGKRSLAADLKQPALAQAVDGLIAWADVIHHNMRPGAAERLGLGQDQVRAKNPEAIYLYSPGWGTSGPDILRQSFAPMLCNLAGASFEVAGQYNEPMPPVGNEDVANGLWGAVAILTALVARRRSGQVLTCESPQLHAAMNMMAHVVRGADGAPIGAERLDITQSGVDALESLYETRDGWVCLAAQDDAEIRALESLLDLRILADPDFATPQDRRANREPLAELLRAAFAKRDSADWLARAAGSGLGLVEPADAGVGHRFLNDLVQRRIGRTAATQHPREGELREFDRLFRLSDATFDPHRPAPALGEHSEEVLKLLGYDDAAIAALCDAGVVVTQSAVRSSDIDAPISGRT
jgi:crotonobetainyl-CoA:carnitine CoA-transferase CaiB-like acyl-CoA transferase